MLFRQTQRRRTPAAIIAGGVLTLATLTGCSSGPLDTKCSEFMDSSESEQTDIIVEWNKDAGISEEMAEMGASGYLDSFRNYCGDEAHADDKIGDLDLTFG